MLSTGIGKSGKEAKFSDPKVRKKLLLEIGGK